MAIYTQIAAAVTVAATIVLSHKRVHAVERRIKDGKRVLGAPTLYDGYIRRYAAMYGIDPKLLKAKIYWESEFRPDVRSPVGAYGLAQVTRPTWEYIWKYLIRQKAPSVYNPRASVQASAAYMRYLLNRFNNNYTYAILAYNRGETAVRKLITRYREQRYVIGALPFETQSYLYGIGTLTKATVI